MIEETEYYAICDNCNAVCFSTYKGRSCDKCGETPRRIIVDLELIKLMKENEDLKKLLVDLTLENKKLKDVIKNI